MAALPGRVRSVWGAFLRLAGLRSDVPEHPAFNEENALVRTVAHVVGHAGSGSLPLRCDELGQLIVAPPADGLTVKVEPGAGVLAVAGDVDASGSSVTLESVGAGVSLPVGAVGLLAQDQMARTRTIPVWVQEPDGEANAEVTLAQGENYVDATSPWGRYYAVSHDVAGICRVYSSEDGINVGTVRGCIAAGHLLVFHAGTRYICITAPAAGLAHVSSWIDAPQI